MPIEADQDQNPIETTSLCSELYDCNFTVFDKAEDRGTYGTPPKKQKFYNQYEHHPTSAGSWKYY